MITNQDRSKWFGASDTAIIMRGWDTETFRAWWFTKCGYAVPQYSSWSMDVGNIMEIPIIRAIEKAEGRKISIGKRPVYRRRLRLRVNYDGLTKQSVVEIKTTKDGFKKPPLHYWQQAQALMYALERPLCELYAYRLQEEDYAAPYFPAIEPDRLERLEIPLDQGWIEEKYLPRLRHLAQCLRRRTIPSERHL